MATSEVNKVSAVWKFRTGRTYLNMPLFFSFSRGTLTSSSRMSVSGATELCSGPASNQRLNIVYPTASSIQIVLRKRYCIHMAMVNTQLLACKQTKKKLCMQEIIFTGDLRSSFPWNYETLCSLTY